MIDATGRAAVVVTAASAPPRQSDSAMFSLVRRLFGSARGKQRRQPPAPRAGKTDPKQPRSASGRRDDAQSPDWRIDTPQDTGFDPYNTGTFNRSGSWERINKRRNA